MPPPESNSRFTGLRCKNESMKGAGTWGSARVRTQR